MRSLVLTTIDNIYRNIFWTCFLCFLYVIEFDLCTDLIICIVNSNPAAGFWAPKSGAGLFMTCEFGLQCPQPKVTSSRYLQNSDVS